MIADALRADPEIERLAASMRARGLADFGVAVVLGSGLGAFAERLERARSVAFAELAGMPRSSVPGHAGRFAIGELGAVRVLVQQGRVHFYEGARAREVVRSVRAMALLGARALLLTNAAGGLRPEWEPGTLMRIADHLDLQRRPALARREAGFGSPYDAALGAAIDRAAATRGIRLERGTYAAMLGPAYETPAEIRMLAALGADAVGMSTAAEALAGAASGLCVAAISCITNHAAGISTRPLSHEEVIEVGRASAGSFTALLEAAVEAVA